MTKNRAICKILHEIFISPFIYILKIMFLHSINVQDCDILQFTNEKRNNNE